MELVDGLAVVLRRRDGQIESVLLGIAAEANRSADEVAHRVDLPSCTEHALRIGNGLPERKQRLAYLLLARSIEILRFPLARILLLDLDDVLQGVDLPDVLLARGIDEDARPDADVARADLFT